MSVSETSKEAELAPRAGVSLAAVTRWEAGERRMGPLAAEAIHNALGAGGAGRDAKPANGEEQR